MEVFDPEQKYSNTSTFPLLLFIKTSDVEGLSAVGLNHIFSAVADSIWLPSTTATHNTRSFCYVWHMQHLDRKIQAFHQECVQPNVV